mmetsp:Transcript_106228/g.148072  ORF Transcript_106228/g.148072 Transcript_106228/m.148072 type:complete len:206 (+) Transcript_106228:324-941(+)
MVAGLHSAKQGRLAVLVLMLHLGSLADQKLADLLAPELRGQEEGRLALLCDLIHLGILLRQASDRGQMPLRSGPHQGGLMVLVQLIHLGPLRNQELAHVPMAVRRCLHQCSLSFLCGIVWRHVKGADQELANLKVAAKRRPHQHIPSFVILQVEGSPIVREDLHHITLALLGGFHEGSHSLVILHVQDPLFLAHQRLLCLVLATT